MTRAAMSFGTGHREFILAGTGGQGLILSGVLLAEAAMLEGRNVVQTQSYGIASRGGLSLAEVIIDPQEIVFQQVRRPDCVLALTEEAAKKYEAWPEQGVTMLYDSTLAKARSGPQWVGLDFTRRASDLGHGGSVNILALGALVAHTQAVRMPTLERLLRKRFGGVALELNLKLLAAGNALGGAGA